MQIKDGHAIPSDAPGLGIAWDDAAIARATVSGSRFEVT
jgi:L-alanine-DL-glutamate epimerase-like enolase superfamily enzyme